MCGEGRVTEDRGGGERRGAKEGEENVRLQGPETQVLLKRSGMTCLSAGESLSGYTQREESLCLPRYHQIGCS